MTAEIDIVVVYHRIENEHEAHALAETIDRFEPEGRVNVLYGNNKQQNIGFGPRCNQVVFDKATAPIVGFLNPDVQVAGALCERVTRVLRQPGIEVTGARFNKAPHELKIWGVHDWVCGAAMFVNRQWFLDLNGFDPQYVWGWEETDFVRRTEDAGRRVKSIELPISHPPAGHTFDSRDAAYKRRWFDHGASIYRDQYGIGMARRLRPSRRRL